MYCIYVSINNVYMYLLILFLQWISYGMLRRDVNRNEWYQGSHPKWHQVSVMFSQISWIEPPQMMIDMIILIPDISRDDSTLSYQKSFLSRDATDFFQISLSPLQVVAKTMSIDCWMRLGIAWHWAWPQLIPVYTGL